MGNLKMLKSYSLIPILNISCMIMIKFIIAFLWSVSYLIMDSIFEFLSGVYTCLKSNIIYISELCRLLVRV